MTNTEANNETQFRMQNVLYSRSQSSLNLKHCHLLVESLLEDLEGEENPVLGVEEDGGSLAEDAERTQLAFRHALPDQLPRLKVH
jgi:hypothetical protein